MTNQPDESKVSTLTIKRKTVLTAVCFAWSFNMKAVEG